MLSLDDSLNIQPVAMPIALDNRETWLNYAVKALACKMTGELFPRRLPEFHVSIGIPRASGPHHAIGQCWRGETSSDGLNHVFISPELINPIEIIATLAHECCHAVDNCEHGHRGPFVKMVRALGLEGKPTATVSGKAFALWANELAYTLGSFPHGALNLDMRKKQGTRLVKIECAKCGFLARTTRKWIESASMPIHCNEPMGVPEI